MLDFEITDFQPIFDIPQDLLMSQFEHLDLVSAADGITKKNRLGTVGRQFNAVFRIDHDLAISRAKALDALQASGLSMGPLHGVPLAHKDLIEVAGKEMHVGSKILKGNIAKKNAWVIDELDRAGQVNLGALHMAEFAMSPTGFNGHYGHGLNPWNPDYPCGGSSSGSAIRAAPFDSPLSCAVSQASNPPRNVSASTVYSHCPTRLIVWDLWLKPRVTVLACSRTSADPIQMIPGARPIPTKTTSLRSRAI